MSHSLEAVVRTVGIHVSHLNIRFYLVGLSKKQFRLRMEVSRVSVIILERVVVSL